MAEAVFWDTAAFLALGNRRDRLHAAAIAISNELEREESLAQIELDEGVDLRRLVDLSPVERLLQIM